MSHSTTEITVNRNGVPATRQVRDLVALGNDDGYRIAPPIDGMSDWSVDLREEIVDLLLDALNNSRGFHASLRSIGSLMSWRDELSDEVLDGYRAAIRGDDRYLFANLLISIFNHCHNDDEARHFLEFTKVQVTAVSEEGDEQAPNWAKWLYKGLSHYENTGFRKPEDLTDITDPDVVKLNSALFISYRLLAEGNGTGLNMVFGERDDHAIHLDPMGLLHLAMERPDDIKRISDIVVEHKIVDAGHVVEIMNAPVQSLQDGVL